MLSIVDLRQRGTVTPELAAYLLAALGGGASFMVGAVPGGAGKTTVMGALLNFLPAEVPLLPADSLAAIERGRAPGQPRACYICHEIGPGDYYAYLWGAELRAYFELPNAGHLLATNLHADDLAQARDQICGDNGVPEAAFRRMHLALFLRVEGGWQGKRQLVEVWESDGLQPHRRVFHQGHLELPASRRVTRPQWETAAARMERLLASGAQTIDQVRAHLVAGENP